MRSTTQASHPLAPPLRRLPSASHSHVEQILSMCALCAPRAAKRAKSAPRVCVAAVRQVRDTIELTPTQYFIVLCCIIPAFEFVAFNTESTFALLTIIGVYALSRGGPPPQRRPRTHARIPYPYTHTRPLSIRCPRPKLVHVRACARGRPQVRLCSSFPRISSTSSSPLGCMSSCR
eukprot:312819-Prymnesium_polylepis.3